MKFIAGLRVWVNGAMGKTPQVFPKIRGSANRLVDLHLPLIASISGRRHAAWRGAGEHWPRGRWRPTTFPGRQQVGCVAKTHRDAERCVIASSTHPTGSTTQRPSPAGARPGSTPPLTQGDPPCSSPAWPLGPRQGWAAGSDRFWLCELRVSQHFSTFYEPSVQAMDTPLNALHHFLFAL